MAKDTNSGSETQHQSDMESFVTQPSAAIGDFTPHDIKDPLECQNVTKLLTLHPWASVAVVYDSFKTLKDFERANETLGKHYLRFSSEMHYSSSSTSPNTSLAQHSKVMSALRDVSVSRKAESGASGAVLSQDSSKSTIGNLPELNPQLFFAPGGTQPVPKTLDNSSLQPTAAISTGYPVYPVCFGSARSIQVPINSYDFTSSGTLIQNNGFSTSPSSSSSASSGQPSYHPVGNTKPVSHQSNVVNGSPKMSSASNSFGDLQGANQLVLSNPAATSTSSRAKRKRVISSSTTSRLSRHQFEVGLNSMLKTAFGPDSPITGLTSCNCLDPTACSLTRNCKFKHIAMSDGPFNVTPKTHLSKSDFPGTKRHNYQPRVIYTALDGNVLFQTICQPGPFKNQSFEELRLGDYMHGRRKAPPSFCLFSKLPYEIRRQIWREALPDDGRIVELRHSYDGSKCWTIAIPPSHLTACRESRQEAESVYELAFGLNGRQPLIRFNFKLDTLFLTVEQMGGSWQHPRAEKVLQRVVKSMSRDDRDRVTSLGIDNGLWGVLGEVQDNHERIWAAMRNFRAELPQMLVVPQFTNLEELNVIQEDCGGIWDTRRLDKNNPKHRRILEMTKENDKAIFVDLPANAIGGYYYQDREDSYRLDIIKDVKPAWNVPEMIYKQKRSPPDNEDEEEEQDDSDSDGDSDSY